MKAVSFDLSIPRYLLGKSLGGVTSSVTHGGLSGLRLIDLPEPYVVWFANKGFPKGELGTLLQIVHEIKINGLEYLFEPLREKKG